MELYSYSLILSECDVMDSTFSPMRWHKQINQ